MSNSFETIEYNDKLPAKIALCSGRVGTQTHWHNEIELIYVLSGSLTATLDNRGRPLGRDDVFLIDPKSLHSLEGEADYLSLHISCEFARKLGLPVDDSEFEIAGGSGAEHELRSLMWQLSKTPNEKEYPELLQYSLITDVLHVLFSECRREKATSAAGVSDVEEGNIKQAMDYIDKHFSEEITQPEVAQLLGLHPGYLSAKFKQVAGITFKEYINRVRLSHAIDALLTQKLSVEEAAKAGGFPSERNFITKCKRAYNLTPLQIKSRGGTDNEANLPDNRI